MQRKKFGENVLSGQKGGVATRNKNHLLRQAKQQTEADSQEQFGEKVVATYGTNANTPRSPSQTREEVGSKAPRGSQDHHEDRSREGGLVRQRKENKQVLSGGLQS